MDTWASNAALVVYYERQGFRLVARRRLPADARLPAHYHGIEVALLEEPCQGKAGTAAPANAGRGSKSGAVEQS